MSAKAQGRLDQDDRIPEKRIRSGALHGPLDFVSAKNPENRSRLREELAGIGLPGQAETFIPAESYLEALARISSVDECAGVILQAALTQDFGQIGMLGKAIVHAENLWSAFLLLKDGIAYYQPGSRIDVRMRFGRCRLTYHHPFGKGRAQALDVQYTIGLLCNLVFESMGSASGNLHLRYPGARAEHRRLFGDLGHLSDGEYGMIEFNDHLLRGPLRRSMPSLSDVIFAAIGDLQDGPDSAAKISPLVRALQLASIEHQRRPLSQAEVAWLFDVPVRTLQHNLKTEGCRFDRLRDNSRHALARQALLKGKELEMVAHDIGFAHRQSFSEAFSKWEGCSPSEFRSRGQVRVV